MSKGLKIVLLVVLLVVLGVVAFATLGGENLLGRMRIFSPPNENQSEKPMLPASNEKKSIRVPQPVPEEEAAPAETEQPPQPTGVGGSGDGGGESPTPDKDDQPPPISIGEGGSGGGSGSPAEPEPLPPSPSSTGGSGGGSLPSGDTASSLPCPSLEFLSLISPSGSKAPSLSEILAVYNLSSKNKAIVESIQFSCTGTATLKGPMVFSVYKSGNEKVGTIETSDCKDGVTIDFEPFEVSSSDSVDLLIKADTTALTTTLNDDSFMVYVSNISGSFFNDEKWVLNQCPNNSMPVYGNTLIY